MPRKNIDEIFEELAALGVNVEWLKKTGISDKEAKDLLAGIKRLLKERTRGK